MKLSHIRDLVAVAELGGLRRASRHLGVAQPALSRSIRDLEVELGVPLFERQSGGMALTDIGKAVVRRATGLQHELARMREEVEQLKGKGVGRVSVGLSTVVHIALLPRVIGYFERRFPDVRVDIAESMFPGLEREVQDGTIDFYVGPIDRHHERRDLIIEPLFGNRRRVFGRQDHPLGHATSLRELEDASWVLGPLTLSSADELTPLFAQHGLPPPRIVVTARTTLGVIMTASGSDLLTMLPQQWNGVFEGAGLIVPIPVAEELPAPPVCCVRRASISLTPVAEHLCDLFRRAALNHARELAGASVLS